MSMQGYVFMHIRIYIYIYIYIHKWFSNIKLNKSAQWVERLYLCRKRVNEYSNN